MKRAFFFLPFLLAGVVLAQQAPVPEIPYRSVPNFLKLPPDLYFGEVSGVAVNSKGHIFVFSRGNTDRPGLWRGGRAAAGVRPQTASTFARSATISTRGRSRMR